MSIIIIDIKLKLRKIKHRILRRLPLSNYSSWNSKIFCLLFLLNKALQHHVQQHRWVLNNNNKKNIVAGSRQSTLQLKEYGQNPINDWKCLESKFHWPRIWNSVPGIWNPESKTVLDSLKHVVRNRPVTACTHFFPGQMY